ncbi:MAG: outer membrane lipoprotein LolB [Betaproteobacteria bacterium]|nr:outer membrane lipoprotein LolB [Betaproteobacteria bacterium]
MARFFLTLAFSLLVGCASVPPAALSPRDEVRNFSLDARFALRATLPGQTAQSSGGRLSWTHRHDNDLIQVANPLGYGVAEIDAKPTISRLRTADGKVRESADPDALIEDVTGLRLPVARLPGWLLGRPSTDARIETDSFGRPGKLHEAGWLVDYFYDDERVTSLPVRLTISRPGEIEIKLRIEEWRETP